MGRGEVYILPLSAFLIEAEHQLGILQFREEVFGSAVFCQRLCVQSCPDGFAFFNLLADVLNMLIDPRLREEDRHA